MHKDEDATQSEVLQLLNKGASRRSNGYVLKAIGRTPGEPQVLREECRNREATGLSTPRQDGTSMSRFEFAKAKTQTKWTLAVSTSQGGPTAKGQSAEGIVDEKSVG